MKTLLALAALLTACVSGLGQAAYTPATISQATNGIAVTPYISPFTLDAYNNFVILPEILANGGGGSGVGVTHGQFTTAATNSGTVTLDVDTNALAGANLFAPFGSGSGGNAAYATNSGNASVATNLSYVFTPSKYGAVGDGITDDTLAFSNMINAVDATIGHCTIDLVGQSYFIQYPTNLPTYSAPFLTLQNGKMITSATNGVLVWVSTPAHFGNMYFNMRQMELTNTYNSPVNNTSVGLALGPEINENIMIEGNAVMGFYRNITLLDTVQVMIYRNQLGQCWSNMIYIAYGSQSCDACQIVGNDLNVLDFYHTAFMMTNVIAVQSENSIYIYMAANNGGGCKQALSIKYSKLGEYGDNWEAFFDVNSSNHVMMEFTNSTVIMDSVQICRNGQFGSSNYLAQIGLYNCNLQNSVFSSSEPSSFDLFSYTGSSAYPKNTAGGRFRTHSSFGDVGTFIDLNYGSLPSVLDQNVWPFPQTFSYGENFYGNQGANSLANNSQKNFNWVGFRYDDTSWIGLMKYISWSSGHSDLILGGNEYFPGVTAIYLDTSPDTYSSSVRQWAVDSSGNLTAQHSGQTINNWGGNIISGTFTGNGSGLTNVTAQTSAIATNAPNGADLNIVAKAVTNTMLTQIDTYNGVIEYNFTYAMDWINGYLFDGSGYRSVDWHNRTLNDATGNVSVNWVSKTLSSGWTATNLALVGTATLNGIPLLTNTPGISTSVLPTNNIADVAPNPGSLVYYKSGTNFTVALNMIYSNMTFYGNSNGVLIPLFNTNGLFATALTGTISASQLPSGVVTNGATGIVLTNAAFSTNSTSATLAAVTVNGPQTNNGALIVNGGIYIPLTGRMYIGGTEYVTAGSAGFEATTMLPTSAGKSLGTSALPWVGQFTTIIASGSITATNGFASYAPHTPVAVTVGASPFSYTNTTPVAQECYFSGATAYAVTKMGASVYASMTGNSYFVLQPTNYCTLTYTVAPTLFTNAW